MRGGGEGRDNGRWACPSVFAATTAHGIFTFLLAAPLRVKTWSGDQCCSILESSMVAELTVLVTLGFVARRAAATDGILSILLLVADGGSRTACDAAVMTLFH